MLRPKWNVQYRYRPRLQSAWVTFENHLVAFENFIQTAFEKSPQTWTTRLHAQIGQFIGLVHVHTSPSSSRIPKLQLNISYNAVTTWISITLAIFCISCWLGLLNKRLESFFFCLFVCFLCLLAPEKSEEMIVPPLPLFSIVWSEKKPNRILILWLEK